MVDQKEKSGEIAVLRKTLILLAFLMVGSSAAAQDLRALARVDLAASSLRDVGERVQLKLALSQGVPFKIATLDEPARIVIDFREVAFDPSIVDLDRSARVSGLQAGTIRSGWSRLVIGLTGPMAVANAWLTTDPERGTAVLQMDMGPVTQEEFSRSAVVVPKREPAIHLDADAKPVIALDPGHGGIDPGAQRGGQNEADLMLQFARELRETLLRSGRYEVVLTRTEDKFVSLPMRVSVARAAGADVFLSLHADALAKGRASGLTVYTLSQDATDAASEALAERQNRADIVAGVDLEGDDDQIATVLMDLARQDTQPKANLLADTLVTTMRETLGHVHKRPRLEAGFSVLKAPDIPSVLIELGFMSSKDDLAALNDPQWREKAGLGILGALDTWVRDAQVAGNP